MRAELANLNHCTVPFLSRAAVYTSFIPHYFKVVLVKTLVTRVCRLCSNWHLSFDSEIDKITELLMHDGYNKTFLENIIGNQLHRLYMNYVCIN